MTIKEYSFIKNGEVINSAIFDDPSNDLLNTFKEEFQADLIVESGEYAEVGGTYDGTKFWPKKRFPSWIKDEENHKWIAPTPLPEKDPELVKYYEWIESTLTWEPFEKIFDESNIEDFFNHYVEMIYPENYNPGE
jgi:hypothetical protein